MVCPCGAGKDTTPAAFLLACASGAVDAESGDDEALGGLPCAEAPVADSDRMLRQFGQPVPVTLGQAGDNRGVFLLIAGILNPDYDFAMLVL